VPADQRPWAFRRENLTSEIGAVASPVVSGILRDQAGDGDRRVPGRPRRLARERTGTQCREGTGTPLLGGSILQTTWVNVREHAADPHDYWGSRGRRFRSGRPDGASQQVSAGSCSYGNLPHALVGAHIGTRGGRRVARTGVHCGGGFVPEFEIEVDAEHEDLAGLCSMYWATREDGSFAHSVKVLSDLFDQPSRKISKIVSEACFARSVSRRCSECDRGFIYRSRAQWTSSVRFVSGRCRNCTEAEQRRRA
jgi:hypothetical protein